ncbi:methyltransferase-like protein 6 [Centruroides sculpturatus]|uniref:methyltransferase-like protein 6 n=1 Tax=Centruroides sculpturatus TaxID=218467 RepID=UPI000C6E984B|nr:methyltransferase-like protein 6 [Centruroides sculpturatus]
MNFEVSEDENLVIGHYAKTLNPDEIEKLNKDVTISKFHQNKLENEAKKNWDLFYKRNEGRFFKDRHWTKNEFEEFTKEFDFSKISPTPTMLEIGCGVGNFIFPLIEEKVPYFIYACDFSSRAIELVKKHPLYEDDVCHAFVCDITEDNLKDTITENSVDIVSMIFVLSAIHPDKMPNALKNIYQILKPGGIVIFRDYGLYDAAMFRFNPARKLAKYFYVRQDGTRAYYFSEEYLAKLFEAANFEVIYNKYVKKETVNKKENISLSRIFIQGKFRKI